MSGQIFQQRPTIGCSFEQLAVTTSVQILTPSKFAGSVGYEAASSAYLTLHGGDIRYTYDGTTPSATVGHILTDGSSLVLLGQNQMEQFKCYQYGSSGSTLSITYERE
jgi:hypothetical protein